MFLPNPFRQSGLLLILLLGFLTHTFAEVPANYSAYDVVHYKLEVKLDTKYERIAGTNEISFKALRNLGFIQLDLDPFMEVAYVSYLGRKLRYDHREGRLRVIFPRELKARTNHTLKVVFYGSPGLSESVLYSGGIMWEKDPIGKDLILTRKGNKGTGCWWPHKYDPRDAADSMQFSVIYSKEEEVIVPGKLLYTQMLPGEFKRWTYALNHKVPCGSIQFAIGDLLRARSSYQGVAGKHPLVAYTVPGQYTLAVQRLEKIQSILAFMENYFGEYPFWESGFHLFEPGFLSEKSQSVFPNKGNIKGTDAWLFDVVISDWIGRSLMHEGEADLWFMNMLKKYSESLYVGYLNGESEGLSFLEKRKEMPAYQSAWMLHGLRRTLGNDQKWWDMIASLNDTYQNSFLNSEELYNHLYDHLGEENQYYWAQYFQKNEVPVLELMTRRKGKKLSISYRWASGVPGFKLPVDLWIFDEKFRLSPEAEWQIFTGKKASEKHINVENPLGLFEVKKTKM